MTLFVISCAYVIAGSSVVEQILNGSFLEALKSRDIGKVLSLDSEELWNSWDLEAIAVHVSSLLDGCSITSRLVPGHQYKRVCIAISGFYIVMILKCLL